MAVKNELQDKVVVITGATSGIGRSCARIYGKAGANIVATGRSDEKLKALSNELHELKIRHLVIRSDAASEEDNKKVVEQSVEAFGKIDILIANAGISMRALFEDLDLEVFHKVMDTNFYGAVYITKYALPHLLRTKGSIVAVSSINGHRGTPARTAYTASKYAMEGFYEALRTELMHRGMHVLVVSPGFTGTNIRNAALMADGSIQGESPRDEGSMMSADEVAYRMLKATLARKRDIVLTFQGKLAVWLNKFIPGAMDKIVYNTMAREADSPFK
ncbi:MAG: SDR family oxidoreductase [Cyclobacteriaceae bacterium]|nr:SDR family oxidoreductase [Cyclobacteriaceae bacterium]